MSNETTDLERQAEAQTTAERWRVAAGHLEAAAQAWLLADPHADAEDAHDDYGNVLEARWGATWNAHYWAHMGAQPLPERPAPFSGPREDGWWARNRAASQEADRLTADLPRRPRRTYEDDED